MASSLSTHHPRPSPTTPPTPPSQFTLGSFFSKSKSLVRTQAPFLRPDPAEVINSWELMAGLEYTADSFRFFKDSNKANKENSDPNRIKSDNLSLLIIKQIKNGLWF
jgi:hypothetical protein